jgi:hypothetical protein
MKPKSSVKKSAPKPINRWVHASPAERVAMLEDADERFAKSLRRSRIANAKILRKHHVVKGLLDDTRTLKVKA